MPKVPHLHRRSETLYFRIWVPVHLRPIVGVRELTKSLQTQSQKEAAPIAYRLAGESKKIFYFLDSVMSDENREVDLAIDNLIDGINKRLADVAEEMRPNPDQYRGAKTLREFAMVIQERSSQEKERERQDEKLEIDRTKHREELRRANEQAELEAYRKIFSSGIMAGVAPVVSIDSPSPESKPVKIKKGPALKPAFELFLKSYRPKKGDCDGEDNRTKIEGFGKLFEDFIGSNKSISDITQTDINEFFRQLVKYPGGRGGQSKAFKGLTFQARIKFAEDKNLVRISPKAYDSNYKSPCGLFIKHLRATYDDLAPAVTVDAVNYKDYGGLRNPKEEKQRALFISEVDILMNNSTMIEFVQCGVDIHRYWLPMLGLFTGARVNEICQLNPQTDILQDKNEIWYLHLTNENAGDGVKKSHKNKSSRRKVPIHSKLIDLGFLNYWKSVKSAGYTRIFPKWKPKGSKASYYAEEDFREYLRIIGLRDETPHKMVLGMHTLRSTFITHAKRCLMEKKGIAAAAADKEIAVIVGHTDGELNTQTGEYTDDSLLPDNLLDLRRTIEFLDYGVFP